MSLIGFLVSGCSLTVPNIEVCRDKGELGARCGFTNNGPSRDIPLDAWQQERFGQFCMKEVDFAKNQKFFEEACLLVKGCKIEDVRKSYKILIKNLEAK
jgi:hypothetical protein